MALPAHVAIIMDGNGRWARKRALPRLAGHRRGMRRMLALADEVFARGIPYFTVFALSTENLSRPQSELDGIFGLLKKYFEENTARMKEEGIRIRVLSSVPLPEEISLLAARAEQETAAGERGTLAIAAGYGARQDIVSACNKAVREGREVDLASFAESLSTGGMPAVDLLIRTGKEKRLSNFLLFEAAYAELVFSDKYFPDFTVKDLGRALEEYAARDRRFGNI